MPRIHTPTQSTFATAIDLGTLTTGNSATYVDTLGYGAAMIVYNVTTASASTLASKVQECATSGGSYTDVTGAAIATVAASTTRAVPTISLLLSKRLRFLQLAHTVTGTVTGSVVVILFNPVQSPVSQTIAAVEIA